MPRKDRGKGKVACPCSRREEKASRRGPERGRKKGGRERRGIAFHECKDGGRLRRGRERSSHILTARKRRKKKISSG